MRNEARFRMVERADPARYKRFLEEAQAAAERRYSVYQQLAGITVPVTPAPGRGAGAAQAPKEGNEPRHDLPGAQARRTR